MDLKWNRVPESGPKISIITPSLNQAPFLEGAMVSVLSQNYSNLEYVIIDGGSHDGSVEIIRHYSEKLAYWCSEPDGGQACALNKALDHVTGDIVAYLCADDRYYPGTLDLVAQTFGQHHDKRWLAGSCRYYVTNGPDYESKPEPPMADRVQIVCGPWGVPQPANFWRRELFVAYGSFRENLNYIMDTEFQIRLALAGEIPILVEKELAYALLHPECKSIKSKALQLQEQSRLLQIFWHQLTKEEQRRARVALCFRSADIANKLAESRVYQYWLWLKGAIEAVGISPKWALRHIGRSLCHQFVRVRSPTLL